MAEMRRGRKARHEIDAEDLSDYVIEHEFASSDSARHGKRLVIRVPVARPQETYFEVLTRGGDHQWQATTAATFADAIALYNEAD